MTDYRTFYDKDFIGAWDLNAGDKTITMTRCIGGNLVAPGGRKSKKPVVYFQGSEKGFALNATNGKTIAALYGNMVEAWVGKRITLYKSMTRSPDGSGDVECIRVRPTVPGRIAEDADAPIKTRTDTLTALCKDAGVTLPDVLAKADVQHADELSDDDYVSATAMLQRKAVKRMAERIADKAQP